MNISLRHYDEQVKFNVEKDIKSNSEERIFVHTNSQFYFSMSIKEADQLCEKLKQCLMTVELSRLFNKPIKMGN